MAAPTVFAIRSAPAAARLELPPPWRGRGGRGVPLRSRSLPEPRRLPRNRISVAFSRSASYCAAAGALRIANTVGAAITHHRVLGDTESGPVLAGALTAIVLTFVAVLWPAIIAWPLALIGAWFAVNLSINWFALRRRRRENAS